MPFIVLEGLDGAGKSTQLEMLKQLISSKGLAYEYLHFPRFDTPVYGELIARFLRGDLGSLEGVNPYLVALIFAGDRADAGSMMRRWLDEGKYVVTDRFVYSNIAFQCAKFDEQADKEALRKWILDLEFGYNKLPLPDVSLFLDVPFEFTKDRLSEQREGDDRSYLNGEKDIHEESLELQAKVRQMYMRCAEEDAKLKVIDCSDGNGKIDTPENNFSKILENIATLL